MLPTAIRRNLSVCSAVIMAPIIPLSQTEIFSTTVRPVNNIYYGTSS